MARRPRGWWLGAIRNGPRAIWQVSKQIKALRARAPKVENPAPVPPIVSKHLLRKRRQAAQRAAEAAKRGAR